MASAILDQLSKHLIRFAQDALERDGEFRPFGAIIDGEERVQYCAADDDPQNRDFRGQIETLKKFLRELSEKESTHAAGFCFDVIVHREGNPNQEAIHCSLEHADGEAIEHFTPYSKTQSGAVQYGESYTSDRHREIFGLVGLVLTAENRDPVQSPTVCQLKAAVASLTPRGGPGFLVLEGATEDYAQAAGGDGKFTAEWREYADGTFMHWVAGLAHDSTNIEHVEIETNGCVVTVRKNEVLASEDVRSILGAFARGKGKPTQYVWRDITSNFVKSTA